jgi:hypothetical protein
MGKLLIASVLGALLAGSGIAVAQIVDDPPGSVFQTQGIRESEGLRAVPSPYVRAAQAAQFRAARAAALARQARAYAYIPVPAVPHHKVVRRHR